MTGNGGSGGVRAGDVHPAEVLASLGDALFLVAPDDKVVFVNSRLEELGSLKASEIVGRPYNCLFGHFAALTGTSGRTLNDLFSALDQLAQSPLVEFSIRSPAPRELQCRFFALPISPAGEPTGWGGVIRDISALFAQAALRTRTLLTLSDELRSSFVLIKGFAGTLLSDPDRWLEEERREFLEKIAHSTDASIELLEHVRDMAQLQLADLKLECRATDFKRLTLQVTQRLMVENADLKLQVSLPDELPQVDLDALRILRALYTLLNSVTRLASYGSELGVGVEHQAGRIQVNITYQGVDISERLTRQDFGYLAENRRDAPGEHRDLDLGLYVAGGIFQAHGGRVWTDTSSPPNTVIHIVLPLESRSTGAIVPELPLYDQRRRALDVSSERWNTALCAKLLVIEDDALMARLLKVQLELGGYRVVSAAEGELGIHLAMIEVPDLILLDIYLPDGDGFAFCRRLREFTAAPIIMITASSKEEDMIHGLSAGADDYLRKPLRNTELLARIQACLRRSLVADLSRQVHGEPVMQVGELVINFGDRQVTVGGKPVDLTPIEYKLLHYLAMNAGRVLTHDQIVSKVWGPVFKQETQYLWVNISRLRGKIERNPRKPEYILTERGVGYYFPTPDSASAPHGLHADAS